VSFGFSETLHTATHKHAVSLSAKAFAGNNRYKRVGIVSLFYKVSILFPVPWPCQTKPNVKQENVSYAKISGWSQVGIACSRQA
jgi:hypothetical protein